MAIEFTVFKGSLEGKVVESRTSLPELSDRDVLVQNTHSGVCGTDAHFLSTDMVLGHEGVGIVKAVGPNVKRVKVGDRVGFGYVKEGCGKCSYCLSGSTWHCAEGARFFAGTDFNQGSFATHSVWPDTRLVVIPESIPSVEAGPFMCAGQTVFVPFLRHGIKPTDRVGIMGIGGLGHLAIQFARAWGCEVVVFSTSESKREEAMAFGATEFYATKNGFKPEDLPRKLNHLLVTTSTQPDWDLYVKLMAPFGNVYPLTISNGTINFPYMALVGKEISIHGSCSSTANDVDAMLRFAVAHKIKPVVQTFPMSVAGITEAFERLESGKIRYRGVLEI